MNSILRRREIIANSKTIFEAKNLVLTGDNFVDTGFMPFSSENINKDFEVNFYIDGTTTGTDSQYVIMGCKYEGNLNSLDYPGIYIRGTSTPSKLEIGGFNYWKADKTKVLNCNFKIKRVNGAWSAENDLGDSQSLSVRSTVFNQPFIIGAGKQTDGTMFRFGQFTIKYINVRYL